MNNGDSQRISFGLEALERIERLYTNNTSLEVIAREFSVSPPVIRRVLKDRGVQIRGVGRIKGKKLRAPEQLSLPFTEGSGVDAIGE